MIFYFLPIEFFWLIETIYCQRAKWPSEARIFEAAHTSPPSPTLQKEKFTGHQPSAQATSPYPYLSPHSTVYSCLAPSSHWLSADLGLQWVYSWSWPWDLSSSWCWAPAGPYQVHALWTCSQSHLPWCASWMPLVGVGWGCQPSAFRFFELSKF